MSQEPKETASSAGNPGAGGVGGLEGESQGAESVKVFVSVEGASDVWSVEVPRMESVAGFRALLAEKYARPEIQGMAITVEDREAPADAADRVSELFGSARRGRVHLHRCVTVAVTVEYNGKSHARSFAPATTAHRVFVWAIGKDVFNVQSEAHDLDLQIPGAISPLAPNVHIGAIATQCSLKLEMIPKDRPQG